MALLAHLHRVGRPVRVGDIARALAAPRSTVYAVVRTLSEAGLLETAGPSGEVFFGRAIYVYGMDYLRDHDLFGRARLAVDRLAQDTGEMTQLCIMHDGKYTVAYMSAGSRSFRISSDIGTQVPLPWTASGRLLVADLADDEIRRLIGPDDLQPPRSAAITIDDFLASVREACRGGFCVTSGLVDPFTHCIAAPIRDQTSRVVATLCFVVTLGTTSDRMTQLRDILMAGAHSLSLAPPAPEPAPVNIVRSTTAAATPR